MPGNRPDFAQTKWPTRIERGQPGLAGPPPESSVRKRPIWSSRLQPIVTAWQQSPPGRFFAFWQGVRADELAIQIAYSLLFATFPFLLALSSIAGGLLGNQERRAALVNQVVGVLPLEVAGEVIRTLDATKMNAGLLGFIGFVGIAWSASSVFVVLENAFNRVWIAPKRSFLRERVLAVLLVPAAGVVAALAFLAAGLATAAATFAHGLLPSWLAVGWLRLSVGWGLSLAVLFLLMLACYWVVPNRRLSFGEAWPGALVAGFLLFVLIQVFPLYLQITGGFNRFGAAFGFTLLVFAWFHFLGQILMLGVALNAFLARVSEPEAQIKPPPGHP